MNSNTPIEPSKPDELRKLERLEKAILTALCIAGGIMSLCFYSFFRDWPGIWLEISLVSILASVVLIFALPIVTAKVQIAKHPFDGPLMPYTKWESLLYSRREGLWVALGLAAVGAVVSFMDALYVTRMSTVSYMPPVWISAIETIGAITIACIGAYGYRYHNESPTQTPVHIPTLYLLASAILIAMPDLLRPEIVCTMWH